MPHISYSELSIWNTCPYKHKLIYIDKNKPKGSIHTAFGTAVHNIYESQVLENSLPSGDHKGIDHWQQKFQLNFLNELRRLPDIKKLDEEEKKIVHQMRCQGHELCPLVIPELKNQFGNFELIKTEDRLSEDIKEFEQKKYKFKGFIDLLIKTEDGKYIILDWKTCKSGWMPEKKRDKMTAYQLVLYKHYAALKYGIPSENIETYFALLKRAAKSKRVEFLRMTSGPKRTENALELLTTALHNICNENYVKNRTACYKPFKCQFCKGLCK